MVRSALLMLGLLAWPVWALDASLPDASAGMGGADMTSEENDGRDPCLSAKECERGFRCTNGRCTPAPPQTAGGCGGGSGGALALVTMLPLTLGFIWRARRY